MAKAKQQPDPNRIEARKEMELSAATPEQFRRDVTRLMVSPEFAAMRVVRDVEGANGYGANLDIPELANCLREQAAAVQGGNLAHAEAMLMNQSTALQSLFARLVERGMRAEQLPQYEAHLRLALRAQAQCRATLETLAAIKNPPVVFAKQANIAQQQQVNNHAPAVPTRAREVEKAPTQLLETLPDERLDFGTQGAASGVDSDLATVGTVHRPQDARG